MKHGKKYNAAAAKYDLTKKYDVASACKMIQDMKFTKFDETVEAHVALRLEKNATVRDTLVFPNQFRGEKKVLVFCKGDKVKEALDAGAAFAGEEYIEKVKGGELTKPFPKGYKKGSIKLKKIEETNNGSRKSLAKRASGLGRKGKCKSQEDLDSNENYKRKKEKYVIVAKLKEKLEEK